MDQNGFLHFHSTFSHRHLWPCQMRRLGFQHLSRVASLHMPWDLTWHPLCFPGRDTDPCSGPGWTWICQHCYCVPLRLPNSSIKQKAMLSEIITVWLTCLQPRFLCSLCLDILCTTELGIPWARHFLSHSLIPGSPLLLESYACLRHLHKVFYATISIWPNLSCLLRLLLQCHLWVSGIHP